MGVQVVVDPDLRQAGEWMGQPPRNIELERLVIDALRAEGEGEYESVARAEAWAVYADWLLSVGEPVGEWLAASLRADVAGDAAAPVRARLSDIESQTRFRLVDLELADLSEVPELERIADFTWERGFITAAAIRCSSFRAWDSELLGHTPDRLLDVVLRSPSARMLHSLELDRWQFDAIGSHFSSVSELLGELPGPLALRRLSLHESIRSDRVALDARSLASLVELTHLELHAGPASLRAPLELPHLRRLAWRGRSMSLGGREALANSRLSELHELELCVEGGDPNFGGGRALEVGAQLAELEPLWSGELVPKLHELRLTLEGASAAMVRGLVSGPLLDRLDALELGALDEAGAHELLGAASRFARVPRTRFLLDRSGASLGAALRERGLDALFEGPREEPSAAARHERRRWRP